ncbi:hypothetical protein BST79_gp237 [Only Syngen Nebraska virus 5]|uniref:hypothetical protein n=1 Tax=Only Syngen Nebraska virus 5 TaxID=1917232 RepID=UPI00090175CB|nr:hypothetical protein BST79_gp237 [Only Syngen Nebraska virus 5]APC25750.1 hypothetical protein [Only Syngen Nebraska virus 5]
MIGTILLSESKFLFSKPVCNNCGGKPIVPVDMTVGKMAKVAEAVKKQAAEIRTLLSQKQAAPKAPELTNPIEHIQASTTVVTGSNGAENVIDEDLPFSDFKGVPVAETTAEGMIKGIRPPTYADPRVMNPALAAAPVQFSDPAQFGTFGVTDDVSPAFSTEDKIPKTNAKISSDISVEGYENSYDANGARLVMDGKVVKSECQLPSYQIRNSQHHTQLPMRSLHEPPPKVEDLVDESLFEGLQGYPIDEKLDLLTPPGTATPSSEWAAINYGLTNN